MSRLVIINPVSGKGQSLKVFDDLEDMLSSEPYQVAISTDAQHIYRLGNTSDFSVFSSVIIFGGDGSMHNFINGMLDRSDGLQVPIGLIPMGTGNSLMHDLEIFKPEKAINKILRGGTMHMDIGKISFAEKHIYSMNAMGWGLPSTVNQKAEDLKFFGGQRYNFASLAEIVRNPNWNLELTIDDEELDGNYCFFMACNTIHTGKGMKVAPRASLTDGKLDLVLLKKASWLQLIKLFRKIFSGAHIDDPLVEYRQASKFSLSEAASSTLVVDGEVAGRTPFSMEAMPGAIEIFC